MQPTTSMASKYRFLFKVPGSGYASLLLLITGFALGMFQGLLSPGDLYSSILSGVLAMGIVPIAMNIFSKVFILKGFKVASFRRLNHLSLLENYFFLAAAGIGALVSYSEGTILIYSVMIYSVISLSIFIRSTILSTFTHNSLIRGFASGLLEPLFRGLVIALVSPIFFSVTSMVISVSIGTALSVISLLILLRPIKENVNPLRLAGGFAAALLVGDGSYLEDMLERLSSEFSGVSEALLFRRSDGKDIALVITPYHLGPFRSIGSSMLNVLIENELQRHGIEGLVLKGCTGHEANLVSSNESKKICKEIVEGIRNDSSPFTDVACYCSPIRHGKVSILGLSFNHKHVLIPTLHPEPMEDLPQVISHIASHYDAIVVDPHNSYSEGFSGLTEDDVALITEAISIAVKNSNKICGKFMIGFKRIVPASYGLSDGVGIGGFSLIGLAISGKKIALAVIDGNNALPTVRDAVVESLRSEGWDTVELLTTDTHMVNGISLGGKGYYAIGEKISPNDVAKIFVELSRAVSADLLEAEVKYVKIRHEFSKIFSEDLLARLAKKSSYLLTTYLVLMALSFILPLIIF